MCCFIRFAFLEIFTTKKTGSLTLLLFVWMLLAVNSVRDRLLSTKSDEQRRRREEIDVYGHNCSTLICLHQSDVSLCTWYCFRGRIKSMKIMRVRSMKFWENFDAKRNVKRGLHTILLSYSSDILHWIAKITNLLLLLLLVFCGLL